MLTRSLGPGMSGSAAFLGKALLSSALIFIAYGYVPESQAATHQVPPEKSKVDCTTYGGGIRPGDTIVLTGRSRGPITISNCTGSATYPITVRNDTSLAGPLVISQSGSGFQTQCIDCEYVIIDGTGKWAGAPAGVCGASIEGGRWKLGTTQCGIVLRCVSGTPHSGLRLAGGSKHVTVKGVEIDANVPVCSKGIGLSVNDHNYTASAGEWREGIRLLNNYVHDTEGEGMYVGPNQNQNSFDNLQLRNNEIAFNFVDMTGCDGINYKSAIAGASSIHHNYVTNTGQTPRGIDSGCSGSGIALFEAGYTDVYSNYAEAPSPVSSGPGNCISQFVSNLSASKVSTVPVKIYNNVTRNCKGSGISSGRRDTSVAEPVVTVYNNTLVPPIGGGGINIKSTVTSCKVHDNIVAGKTINAKYCVTKNNSTATVDYQKFRDASARDYRLTATSPAVDIGTTACPASDHAGTLRPQELACDQGAFEFVSKDTDTKPNPPELVLAE